MNKHQQNLQHEQTEWILNEWSWSGERKEEMDGEIEVSSRVHKPKARPELKQHGAQKKYKRGKWRKKNNDKKFITISKKKVTATTPKNDCRKLNKSAAL